MENRQLAIAKSLNDIAPVIDALRREIENLLSHMSELATSAPQSEPPPHLYHRIGKTRASQFVRQMLQERRQRDEVFGANLFGEPAWDMLLDLFVATEERRKVSVSSLCIAASVPSTTALRWIGHLTARGFIVRRADPSDARRVFLELASHVHQEMSQLVVGWMGDQSSLQSE